LCLAPSVTRQNRPEFLGYLSARLVARHRKLALLVLMCLPQLPSAKAARRAREWASIVGLLHLCFITTAILARLASRLGQCRGEITVGHVALALRPFTSAWHAFGPGRGRGKKNVHSSISLNILSS
jgi:hypothetical protein